MEKDFWREYLRSGVLERRKLVKGLSLVQEFADFKWHKLGREQRTSAITTMLNGYFEELIDEMKR